MDISFVIIANSNWGDYATPYINSIRKYAEDVEIVLVDNGSDKPYKPGVADVLIRLEQTHEYNYMRALNWGIDISSNDWLFVGNDDVLCNGFFESEFYKLRPDTLYGAEIRSKSKSWGVKMRYVYGWLTVMHRTLYNDVGLYDENYIGAGFDDIDYSWRAVKKGYFLGEHNLPFTHLADQIKFSEHRRCKVKDYNINSDKSKAYFLSKVKL